MSADRQLSKTDVISAYQSKSEPASDIEAHLLARYGSLDESKARAEARSAEARAAAHARYIEPPRGWPVVGSLLGAEKWVAIDTETTGLSLDAGHRVVDLAVIVVENGEVIAEWQTYIDPGPDAVWTKEAEEVNNISPATVAGAPSAAEAWAKFVQLTEGLPIAAHNVAFDSAFVANELKLAGLPEQTNTWHCTMIGTGRRRWPKLSALYFAYSLRWIRNSHTALGDAQAVAYLAPIICGRL